MVSIHLMMMMTHINLLFMQIQNNKGGYSSFIRCEKTKTEHFFSDFSCHTIIISTYFFLSRRELMIIMKSCFIFMDNEGG